MSKQRHEYPTLLYFMPIIWYAFYLWVRHRNLSFFTRVNVWLEDGMERDKHKFLEKVPDIYLPKTYIFDNEAFDTIKSTIDFPFPIIAKPNDGARGRWVEKLNSIDDRLEYHKTSDWKYLVQEFIDYPIELWVFYIDIPHKESKIVWVVEKRIKHIIWDGVSRFHELLAHDPQIAHNIELFYKRNQSIWNDIIPAWVEIQISDLWNHAQWARCIDASHLITDQNNNVFCEMSNAIWWLYRGRYDIKCPSYDDFRAWKNIKILEFNWIESEPLHLFDQEIWCVDAYKKWMSYVKDMSHIAQRNKAMWHNSVWTKNLFSLISKKLLQEDLLRSNRR